MGSLLGLLTVTQVHGVGKSHLVDHGLAVLGARSGRCAITLQTVVM